MATDITKTGQYQVMDPDQVIIGMEGLIKAMPVLYGPNFVGANFSPKCCNIRTGEKMEKTVHHFKNLIAGKLGSIIWTQLNDPVEMARIEANATQGHVVDSTKQAILAQHREKIEELDAVGFLPQADHRTYSVHIAFNENKIRRDRTAVEERRLKAAEKKSGLTGNFKKAASNINEAMGSEQPNRKTIEDEKKNRQGSSRVKKSSRPDPAVFKNKRGGKNVAGLPGFEDLRI
ncbi:hypothetical protein N0V95_008375 [Ascochyta clinopodiicola]|nr:hypothetical protein N0V95_008375 [Ascochyta clinopodiicola]